jgi:hypothetical protein
VCFTHIIPCHSPNLNFPSIHTTEVEALGAS